MNGVRVGPQKAYTRAHKPGHSSTFTCVRTTMLLPSRMANTPFVMLLVILYVYMMYADQVYCILGYGMWKEKAKVPIMII